MCVLWLLARRAQARLRSPSHPRLPSCLARLELPSTQMSSFEPNHLLVPRLRFGGSRFGVCSLSSGPSLLTAFQLAADSHSGSTAPSPGSYPHGDGGGAPRPAPQPRKRALSPRSATFCFLPAGPKLWAFAKPRSEKSRSILTPEGRVTLRWLTAGKRPRGARRQTVVKTRGPKFTFAEHVLQPRAGKRTPGGSVFQGSCERARTLLRAQSLGFGLSSCAAPRSLPAVEGRQRSWDRS